MTGINITLVRFALDQNSDFLRISQGGVTYNITGNSIDGFIDLPAQLQVPFTLGPSDVTIEFTSDGRGLHSSTLLLGLSRCIH